MTAESRATTIFVANPSFETPVLADGTSQDVAPGWDSAEMYNPTDAQYLGTNGNGTLPAPADGIQTGYIFGASGGADLQILRGPDGTLGTADDPLITINTTYFLTVAVGSRLNFTYGGFSIQLYAYDPNTTNSTLLGSLTDTFTPAPGQFVDATLVVGTQPVSVQGQNLEIRLTNTNGQATDYDNVRLTSTPEPSSALLAFVGLTAVIGRRRFRKA